MCPRKADKPPEQAAYRIWEFQGGIGSLLANENYGICAGRRVGALRVRVVTVAKPGAWPRCTGVTTARQLAPLPRHQLAECSALRGGRCPGCLHATHKELDFRAGSHLPGQGSRPGAAGSGSHTFVRWLRARRVGDRASGLRHSHCIFRFLSVEGEWKQSTAHLSSPRLGQFRPRESFSTTRVRHSELCPPCWYVTWVSLSPPTSIP